MGSWKRAGQAALLSALLCAAGLVHAQDFFRMTVGLKGWANTWETGTFNEGSATGTNVQVQAADKVAPIPSLSMRFGRFVVSAGYFVKTEYEYEKSSDRMNLACCGDATVTSQTKAEREEYDFNIGWFVHPQVALTVGYKRVDQTYTTTSTAPGVVFPEPEPSTTKNTGVMFGVLGSAPIGGGFALYGNMAIGPMKAEFEGDDTYKPKGTYQSSEFGLAYGFGGAAVTFGYKVQVIDLEIDNTTHPLRLRDTTNGFVAGISYTF
jgi:hypothetical protein